MKGFFMCALLAGPFYFSQYSKDSLRERELQEITFTKRTPVTKEIISVDKRLGYKNLGQDLPILLKNEVATVSTSDAGNGVGYTGFRIRGIANTSMNVMLNGVPYNDSESQGTFFVDVPDLTSSASQLVIQRGVGSSSNGVSAFGASVNILTKDPSLTPYAQADISFGSFNTRKFSAEVGSGLFANKKMSAFARISKIDSDGYIQRGKSDLLSYMFTLQYAYENTKLKLMAFGGKERTYQSWKGIDEATLARDRTYNYSGAIYDSNFENIVAFHPDEVDNYKQNHFHLYLSHKFNDIWKLESTAHYTFGKGYYENYKQDSKLTKYNLQPRIINGAAVTRTDLIRRKWLDNDFYGIVNNLFGNFGDTQLHIGLVANQYYGRHFGEVSGVQITDIKDYEYYRNRSVKNEVAAFAKAIHKMGAWELFGDLQGRKINYDAKIVRPGADEGFNHKSEWTFFNPKAGVSYRWTAGNAYASVAIAHREPSREELIANESTLSEKLTDTEIGFEHSLTEKFNLGANVYYMKYKNQLVYSGVISEIGEFIRMNVPDSYRAGLEFMLRYKPSPYINFTANAAFSQNKIKELQVGSKDTFIIKKDMYISYSPTSILNLRIEVLPVEHLSLGIQNQYISKQYLDNTMTDKLSLPAYIVSDFNATYDFKIRKTQIKISALVNNMFNEMYVNNGYVYGDSPYFFPQAGRNFMLGTSLRF